MQWLIKNHVFANLLMAFLIIVGLIQIFSIKKEVMPEFDLDMITITVPYRGATPEDIEESICIKIEEKIAGIEGIKKISSSAVQGYGTVFVELEANADKYEVYNDIKNAVDEIDTFPERADKPIIKFLENKKQVLNVVVYGDTDEISLKRIAEKLKDEISTLKNVTLVDLAGTKPYEISIYVDENTLRKYHLSLSRISDIIRANCFDLPGGVIKTENNEILVRTVGKKYTKYDFEKIPIIKNINGVYITLGEIAKIKDAFEDIDILSEFNGKKAVFIRVFRSGDQSVLEISKEVKDFIRKVEPTIPKGIKLKIWQDDTKFLKDRISLLLKNAKYGLILVLGSLALFLDLRLAFWVASGMVVAFLGAFVFLPTLDVSINMVSLFAFILCLGIVVDDAIVIGEKVFQYIEEGEDAEKSSIKGTLDMYKPVFFSVATTLAAFYPLFIIPGVIGKFIVTIPKVVFAVLTISYIESVIILPVHLSTIKYKKSFYTFLSDKSSKFMKQFIEKVYLPLLSHVLNFRFVYLALSVTIFLITLSYYLSGRLRFTFFPKVESDVVVASLTMNEGTPFKITKKYAELIEKKGFELKKKISAIKNINLIVGAQPFTKVIQHGGVQIGSPTSGANLAEVVLDLESSEKRNISAKEIANKWRNLVGEIPGAKSLIFSSALFSAGNAIEVNLVSDDPISLKKACKELKDYLKTYPGVYDIRDTFYEGKNEIKIKLTPQGYMLGFNLTDVAREVRAAFCGDESVRIQRKKDDVRVLVKFSDELRNALYTFENMRFFTKDGKEVPFFAIADYEIKKATSIITREDRKRVVKVIADVNENVISSDKVLFDIEENILPKLKNKYLGLNYSLVGEHKEEVDTLKSLKIGTFIALFIIYALMAIPFRSYTQPLIIMIVIPFGLVGALLGHILLGYSLSLLSLLGIVALSGVVVNDSLIMVYSINESKETELHKKIIEVARTRFRPVILTTITTFLGLLPLIMEKSLQAKFLIPMAISLGFGIMFATFITLFIIPIVYYILEDIKKIF